MIPMIAASTAAPLPSVARRLAFDHDQHFLAHARADRVDVQQRGPFRLLVERQRLHEQQLGSFELLVLLSRDPRSDDAADLHFSFQLPAYSVSQWSTMPMIAASVGGSAG